MSATPPLNEATVLAQAETSPPEPAAKRARPAAPSLPSSNDAPTAEEMAIAARVFTHYTASADAMKQLQEQQGEAARGIRKAAMTYAASVKGSTAAEQYEKAVRKTDEKLRRSRIARFKDLDREKIMGVQLRLQRQEALNKLVEPSEDVRLTAVGLTFAGAGALTHDASSAAATVEDSEEVPVAPSKRSMKTNMESADDATAGVEAVLPAHVFGENVRNYCSSTPTEVPKPCDAAGLLCDGTETVVQGDKTKGKKGGKGKSKGDPKKPASSGDSSAASARVGTASLGDLELDKSYLMDNALKGAADADDFTNLFNPLICYVCKRPYAFLHKHYDMLCPPCARVNWAKRHQKADLRGYTAVLTGSRVKIGYECGLRLLRCGARVIATSRFPHDTAKRYANEADFKEWKDRLHVHGLDMRDLKAVVAFTELVKAVYGQVDIIVNNAAQTVRRPALYYRHLLEDELKPREELPEELRGVVKEDAHSFYQGLRMSARKSPAAAADSEAAKAAEGATVEDVTEDVSVPVGDSPMAVEEPVAAAVATEFGSAASVDAAVMASVQDTMLDDGKTLPPLSVAAAAAAAAAANNGNKASTAVADVTAAGKANRVLQDALSHTENKAALLSQLQVLEGEDHAGDDMAKFFPVGLVDVTGQQLDLRPVNSWLLTLSAVEPGELVETFAVNALAPFIINSRLLPAMQEEKPQRPRFVINVSAMEGKFYRHKGPQHPHTNMAKAALNMMTRTSAQECVKHHIYMNSVDTGWINDENPYEKAQRTAKKTMFHTPIDEMDAMARILDPILDAVNTGRAVWGKFLKDFRATEW